MLFVVGALAIAMCVEIYNLGPSPFTRESVGQHFAKISVFVYILVALILGGAVISVALPLPKGKMKGIVNENAMLYKLYSKLGNENEVSDKIEKQRTLRFAMSVVCLVLVIGAAVLSVVQSILGYDAGDADINGQVIKAFFVFLRYFSIAFAYAIVTAYVCKTSVTKELGIIKSQLAKGKTENDSVNASVQQEGTFTKLTNELYEAERKSYQPSKIRDLVSVIVTSALIIVAVVFIILGVSNGGMADVVTKAINICTECIGMG